MIFLDEEAIETSIAIKSKNFPYSVQFFHPKRRYIISDRELESSDIDLVKRIVQRFKSKSQKVKKSKSQKVKKSNLFIKLINI